MSHAHGTHNPNLAHHFPDMKTQFSAAKQGMWLFMVTEVLMLGGLFVAYGIFRGMYPEMFAAAHHLLDWKMGALNTIILITSSLTMVLGVTAAQRGERNKSFAMLALTILCACGFLVVKYFEYTHKFHVGILPGGYFNYHGGHGEPPLPIDVPHIDKAPIFFSLYFVMTGIHGLHVLIGMGLISWLMIRTKRGDFSPSFYTPVELVGFYWHFVDLVWIYLFPLLYLVS